MNQYIYDGPVIAFGACIAQRWRGSTYAVSEKRARSNLAYQFKKENNKNPGAKVTLPGKIVMVREGRSWNGEL